MKCNNINDIVQKTLRGVYAVHPLLHKIIQAVDQAGARAYFVGGMVRDMLLEQPIKDIDIEVHGLQAEALTALLSRFGHVDFIGKSFGVFKLHALPVDWSLPRTDSAGRKPMVAINPDMSIEDALRRRDVTMNAMAIDSRDGTLIDPFGGCDALNNKTLRAPDIDLFAEDPLRFFRVMQFISRFEMYPDKPLQQLCTQMDISTVSRERIEQEFSKMLLRAKRPSLGIRWLQQINRLQEILPELAATVAVRQDVRWHPEGDVFEHTMQTVDAAAQLNYDNDDEKLMILYAALCHDLGKASTTFQDEKGIHSYRHEQVGQNDTVAMLKRITHNQDLIKKVATLVRWHMAPLAFIAQHAKPEAFKRLADKLARQDLNIVQLLKLVISDRRGRNAHSHEPLTDEIPDVDIFLRKAQEAHVAYSREAPLLTGKDFLDVIKPGPLLGRVVQKAYELQLEGVNDKEQLKKLALKAVGDK